MIIAVLEDKKGFMASYSIARFLRRIDVPIPYTKHYNPTAFHCGDNDLCEQPRYEKITFRFYKWLEENKVALYREV